MNEPKTIKRYNQRVRSMKKRGQAEIVVIVVAIVFLGVASYYGTQSIDRNINYVGDLRTHNVYFTSNCLEQIQNIPKSDRVAFGSLQDAVNQNFNFISECS